MPRKVIATTTNPHASRRVRDINTERATTPGPRNDDLGRRSTSSTPTTGAGGSSTHGAARNYVRQCTETTHTQRHQKEGTQARASILHSNSNTAVCVARCTCVWRVLEIRQQQQSMNASQTKKKGQQPPRPCLPPQQWCTPEQHALLCASPEYVSHMHIHIHIHIHTHTPEKNKKM